MLSRRSVFRWLAFALQAAATVLFIVPALRFLFGGTKKAREGSAFIRVANLDSVPVGEPVRVSVVASRTDGYLRYPPSAVGSVWLLRETATSLIGDGADSVRGFQTICPHLGCGIEYAAAQKRFFCPCHASDFDREGRALTGPSPRDMDPLECRITPLDEAGRRWVEVRYVEFRTGTQDRVERA